MSIARDLVEQNAPKTDPYRMTAEVALLVKTVVQASAPNRYVDGRLTDMRVLVAGEITLTDLLRQLVTLGDALKVATTPG